MMNRQNRRLHGKVTIIGFGPGDPELLTCKGKNALEKADIVFYDDLIDKNYLSKLTCRKVFVGKRKGNHSKEQDEINRLLLLAAFSGKNVARLKGGDPSVFGRLGEEVQFLMERSIDVEIIPGVTSASAASSVLGMPLTWRGVSKTVAFCSGHNIKNIKIPDAETLVFYMGASNFYQICRKLISTGWSPDTQAALVSNITLPDQKIEIVKIGEVQGKFEVNTPAVIIAGKIVNKEQIFHYISKRAASAFLNEISALDNMAEELWRNDNQIG